MEGTTSVNQINECREAALERLKPSRTVLEHGIELHGSSLVIDAYGFAPEVFFDPAPIRSAAEEGASDDELQDLCEDMWATGFLDSPEGRAAYFAAWAHKRHCLCFSANAVPLSLQLASAQNVLRVTREALDTDLGRRLPHDDPPSSEVSN